MSISDLCKKLLKHKKSILLTVLSVLSAASILSVGPTHAYLKKEAASGNNTFAAYRTVQPEIKVQTTTDTALQNISVDVGTDNGYSVRVRAAVVVTWVNSESGDVISVSPAAGRDYSMTFASGWSLNTADGYYYYSNPVPQNSETAPFTTDIPFVTELTALHTSPSVDFPIGSESYSLRVQLYAQTIQSEGQTSDGKSPAQDVWGYTFA